MRPEARLRWGRVLDGGRRLGESPYGELHRHRRGTGRQFGLVPLKQPRAGVDPLHFDWFEPTTPRFSDAILLLLDVAMCRPLSQLAAPTVARCRLVSLRVCLRWLPVWLPPRPPPGGCRLHVDDVAEITSGEHACPYL
jgi:hypothetical protein